MEFSTFASPFPLHRQETDLGRLVTSTVEPYRQSPPPGVTVSIEVAPALPPLRLDRRRIQRTLVNLIENAFSALNGDGQVAVTVRPVRVEEREWIELSVADTGVGIAPDAREHIFEPYFSTRAGGTGLGLAIARKAVEEHGGTISLESETGRGTRVFLRLPVDD
jgi:signal transduction histidine kinase